MKIIPTGCPRFEDGETYTADREKYDVYAADTVHVSEEKYIALRGAKDTVDFDTYILLKNQKNITLDFQGATIVLHGKIQPFVVDGCENITIKNVNILYDRPPFTEATILSRKDNSIRVRFNPLCTCRVEDEQIIPYAETWENRTLNYRGSFWQVFDPITRNGCGLILAAVGKTFIADPTFPYHINLFRAEQDGEDVIITGEMPDFFEAGKVLVLTHELRTLSGFFGIDSKNITLDTFRILDGVGMGVMLCRVENARLHKYLLIHDEKSPCLISNAADAIHTFSCSGDFRITDSIIEGMIDDGINVHSNFHTVDTCNGKELLAHVSSCEAEAGQAFGRNSRIAVYHGLTMEKAGEYTIEEIEKLDNKTYRFILDKEAFHDKGDLIENLSGSCHLTIENCVFGKANSHMRLQTRGKTVIRNCDIELPILLSGDASYWFESSPLTDLMVEDCRFTTWRGCFRITSELMPTAKAPYYHTGIKIINNRFETDLPLTGGYADDILFTGNMNTLGKPMRIELTNCGNAKIDNAEVVRKTETKTALKTN